MSKTAAAKNIKTEAFTCNHATGEKATRYTATFACACPACGDAHEHSGSGESSRSSRPSAGSYTIVCSWCGHNFEGPAVAA
jgi:transcription elongation factor Elf1